MDISESLERILRREAIVADLFYVVFLDRFPEVRRFFENVDLKRQAVLLSMALKVIEQHYLGGYLAADLYLKYLGTKHHQIGIPAALYPMFRDALLITLERFHGADWDELLAQQWKAAIDFATETMLEGYEQPYHV